MQRPVNDSLPQCPTGAIYRWRANLAEVSPSRCHRWACSECGPKKARLLAARIVASSARRFITLTCPYSPTDTADVQLDHISRAWRAVWKRIKRQQGPRARGYVRIVELTQRGTPHLHIAADCAYISQRQLSKWWLEVSGAPIVDIRAVKSQNGLARYLAKYLTKAHEVISHRRKWSQSSGMLPPAPPRKDDSLLAGEAWQWARMPAESLRTAFFAGGWLIDAQTLVLPP